MKEIDCYHSDIKEDNIVLWREKEEKESNNYIYTFKLIDCGSMGKKFDDIKVCAQ